MTTEPLPGYQVSGTGEQEHVGMGRHAMMKLLFDAEHLDAAARRQHYFIATMMYKINGPMVDGMVFDASLLRGIMFVCYICEEPYSAKLAAAKCTGEPA